MPLWLDLLKTPMAAPETAELRGMRRTFQILCVASAVGVLAIALYFVPRILDARSARAHTERE